MRLLSAGIDPLFVTGCVLGFVLDVFDGILARRIKVVTALLREADSWADACFYGCIAISLWIAHSALLMAYLGPLLTVIGTQCLYWLVDLIKYRRFTTYHTYSAKLWGVSLFMAAVALAGFQQTGVFLWTAIICGMISHVEQIGITFLLPDWTYDVPSIRHAMSLRGQK